MSVLETMKARLEELRQIEKDCYEQRGALIDIAAAEARDFSDDEQASYDDLTAKRAAAERQIPAVTERITELEEAAKREQASAQLRAKTGDTGGAPARVTDPPIYSKHNQETSFFRDLFFGTQKGDSEAMDRLRRNTRMVADETRALGNTGGAGGSGGEIAPPSWLVSETIMLARPARVAADLFDKQELPAGVSSINIPKVSTGTTTAIQTTQNSALSQTDMTTTSLSSNISTIGGKQVVSLQLIEQSASPGIDRIVMEDLALAYAGALDVQSLSGLGTSGTLRGLGSAAGITTQTYTQASPAVAGAGQFYSMVAQAISKVYATRFLPPDTILLHPRRWAWICASFDTQNRPLVVPSAVAYNPIATDDINVAQGYVGQLQGLDVYVDPNITITNNTNQDIAFVFRRNDIKLWESPLKTEAFTATYADSAGVLYRAYGYSSLIPDRYGSSIVQITGTGMTTPTF